MKLPRDVDADRLIRSLSSYRYVVSRQIGSHIRLTRQDGGHHVTIPNHKPIKPGTLHNIVKEICEVNNLDISDFIRNL